LTLSAKIDGSAQGSCFHTTELYCHVYYYFIETAFYFVSEFAQLRNLKYDSWGEKYKCFSAVFRNNLSMHCWCAHVAVGPGIQIRVSWWWFWRMWAYC